MSKMKTDWGRSGRWCRCYTWSSMYPVRWADLDTVLSCMFGTMMHGRRTHNLHRRHTPTYIYTSHVYYRHTLANMHSLASD